MKKIFSCTNLLPRLCGRRKILSTRMLLRLLVLLQALIVVLVLHAFRFHMDFDIVGNKFVYQSNDLSGVLPKMAAQVQINKTLVQSVRSNKSDVVTPTNITDFTHTNATDKH